MGKTIHIDVNPSHAVEIYGALVARGLGLAVPAFRQLMDRRQITVLCERGTGQDAGLYRASFYHAVRPLRLVVARHGMPVGHARTAERSAGHCQAATERARTCSPPQGSQEQP